MSTNKITQIRFSQYKRFAGTETFDIKPITILVGKNSSGKSSVTKLLPILSLSFNGTLKDTPMVYETENVSLGNSYESVCHNGNKIELAFGASFENGLSIDVSLMVGNDEEMLISQYSIHINGNTYDLLYSNKLKAYECIQTHKTYDRSDFVGFVNEKLFDELGIDKNLKQKIDYIGPFRQIPEPYMKYKVGSDLENVGAKGEKSYYMLYKNPELVNMVSKWFEENFEGCKLKVANVSTDPNTFQIKLSKPDNNAYWTNIVDEGQGTAQILPIVTRGLKSVPDSIIVIEQPELHLHPAAHEGVAKLLAKTTKANRHSYIIETHSENIILGIRDAIVDKSIDFNANDVVIYYVDCDEEGAYLDKITIDEQGMLSKWPDGVFNESYELLTKIMHKAQNTAQ